MTSAVAIETPDRPLQFQLLPRQALNQRQGPLAAQPQRATGQMVEHALQGSPVAVSQPELHGAAQAGAIVLHHRRWHIRASRIVVDQEAPQPGLMQSSKLRRDGD